jgi:hypothetical protein
MTTRRLCDGLVVAALLMAAFHNFIDPDGWWHLRTGQYILSTHSIPRTDLFLANQEGKKWVTHEWLAEVLMYAGYQAGGLNLLMFAFAGLSSAAFWLAYRRSAGRPYIAAISVILGIAVTSPIIGVRPQIISLLFVSVFLTVLERHRSGKPRALWWLVPTMLLWVNLHGAFVMGFALIAWAIAGCVLDRWFTGDDSQPLWPRLRQLGAVFIACIAVVPLNPNGVGLLIYPFFTLNLKAAKMYITEWASPNFHQPYFQAVGLFMILTFCLVALSGAKKRPSSLVLLAATAFGALYSTRNIPIFALVAIPFVAESLADIMKRLSWARPLMDGDRAAAPRQQLLNLMFLILVAAVALVRTSNMTRQQAAVEARLFPTKAVQFIRDHGIHGTIFNVYEWGGYITWHLFPDCRASIDGRPEIYGDQFMTDYMTAYFGGKGWKEPLDASGAAAVMVSPTAPIATLLREQAHWANLYEDDVAVVFVPR